MSPGSSNQLSYKLLDMYKFFIMSTQSRNSTTTIIKIILEQKINTICKTVIGGV